MNRTKMWPLYLLGIAFGAGLVKLIDWASALIGANEQVVTVVIMVVFAVAALILHARDSRQRNKTAASHSEGDEL